MHAKKTFLYTAAAHPSLQSGLLTRVSGGRGITRTHGVDRDDGSLKRTMDQMRSSPSVKIRSPLGEPPSSRSGSSATLKDEVVRLIEEEIISGALSPGTHLDEVQLSQRFGLSRTPLREALAQLRASGLVEGRARTGTFVTRLGIKSILECLAMTAEIEAIAADWAARRMTADEIDALMELHEGCTSAKQSGDPDAYFQANRRFHAAIYAGAHNRYVAMTADFLFLKAAPYRRLQLRQPGRIASSLDEHGEIVAAIAARDGATARHIIHDHILIQGDRFIEFISVLPDSFISRETE